MFKDDIVRSIGVVLKENGHKMIDLGRGCIYFMKRYSPDLAFYIRCSDNRNYQGDISLELFFTAVDIPCDSLCTFGIGVHIQVLRVFDDITDELMRASGEKIVVIENGIGGLSQAILNELETPYVMTGRIPVYKRQRAIYKLVEEDESIRQEFEMLKKDVCQKIRNRRDKQAFQLGGDFAKHLSKEYFRNKGIDLDFEDIQGYFCSHVYAQCILDI
ncbi:MAG: hypothetical protein K2N44_05115 [Lachnospiraceae bacterium]|nr:hypothetical protein [Lachnospiraceae bacterium]MDE7415686.1 hypothetical protein [Lachnospiraceae bacterium]